MIITAELSLYPLKSIYEETIIHFIKNLNTHDGLEVYTTAMSSYVMGESTLVFNAINDAMISTLTDVDTASVVIKIVNRPLPVAEGFLNI